VSEPQRGEVWWAEVAEAGRRPFLVLTRTRAMRVLHSVIAAPLTRTARGIPTELSLGPEDGVPTDCAASFDNIRVIPKDLLTERVCILDPIRMLEACAALRTAVDC
jgi:mRNA interferase MazF